MLEQIKDFAASALGQSLVLLMLRNGSLSGAVYTKMFDLGRGQNADPSMICAREVAIAA